MWGNWVEGGVEIGIDGKGMTGGKSGNLWALEGGEEGRVRRKEVEREIGVVRGKIRMERKFRVTRGGVVV